MVRSSFFGLEIGRTGLTTAQFGLDVTSHNIANVDTAGYTRQRIVQTAYDPFSTIGKFAPVGQGLVGGGTRVQILDQIRSAFLDRRFRTESTTNSYWETRKQSLSYVESFFDNVNEKTSINYSMASFFGAMKILAEDPVSGAPRTLMQTTAMDLAQQLNMIYDGLVDLQRNENRAVETKIGDINRIAHEITELNKAIYGFEITGMIANDLRDKRNLFVDQLAQLIDIEYEEYPDRFGHSMFKLTVAGNILVDHDRRNEMAVGFIDNPLEDGDRIAVPYWVHKMDTALGMRAPSADSPNFQAEMEAYRLLVDAQLATNPGRVALDMSRITGGEIKAHIDMRDGIGAGADSTKRGIPYYIEMLNNLARSLVQEINTQHMQGWSDTPPPNGSKTGIKFFDDTGGGTGPGGTIRYFTADDVEVFDPTDFSIARVEYVLDEAALRNITAKNFGLSQDILDSVYNIAAAAAPIGRPGVPMELQRANNENMNALYAIFGKSGLTMLGRDIGSFDDYGTVIRFDVGNTLNTAKQAAETSRILALAAKNQRTAIAGVSLDEEMVGLVKYQHAYNGAARVITTMDDALDRLINGTGRVGL